MKTPASILLSALAFLGSLSIVSPVVAAGKAPAAVAAEIDKIIDAKLAENKVPASPLADDAEFLRRASLDIRGRIPLAERALTFHNNTSNDKRAKLIDEILADHEYGEHFAIIWYHRMVRIDDDNRLLVAQNNLQDWLTECFNNNMPWSQIAGELLTVQGSKDSNPQTTFLFAHVDDNKGRHDPSPSKITAAASKLFMGVRLECCECHNHPFNTMKQTDFWGVAAFFGDTHSLNAAQKDAKDGKSPSIHDGGIARKSKKDKDNAPHAFGQIVIPDSKGKTVRAKYLNGPEPAVGNHPSLRRLFATWMVSPQNKYFAQAAVNKLWANFFGHGIVNPVDDMDPEKATHPELLKLLSDEFVASGYDQKHLIRCICLSKTYQRTSAVLPENKSDDKLYSHMKAKVMSADMLYDSLAIVLGHTVGDAQAKAKKKDGMKKKGRGRPARGFPPLLPRRGGRRRRRRRGLQPRHSAGAASDEFRPNEQYR